MRMDGPWSLDSQYAQVKVKEGDKHSFPMADQKEETSYSGQIGSIEGIEVRGFNTIQINQEAKMDYPNILRGTRTSKST